MSTRAALEAQARKAPIPVDIRANGVQRYPQEVEAAVYFCCLEALQNIAKYAQATNASVPILASQDTLTVMVDDDGGGFDTRSTRKRFRPAEYGGPPGRAGRHDRGGIGAGVGHNGHRPGPRA